MEQPHTQLWEWILLESLEGQGKRNELYENMRYICVGRRWEVYEEKEDNIRLRSVTKIKHRVTSAWREKEKRQVES